MEKIYKKILIVDGSFLLHRVLSVPNIFDLRNSKGVRTGGIYQFLRSLAREITIDGDYFPIVCFDQGLSKRRTNTDIHYKKYNEHINATHIHLTPDEQDVDMLTQYRLQRNKITEILTYIGIPTLRFPEWEGDDLMYIISKMSENSLVITDDRDLLQLLSDTCNVRRPKADETWDIDRFLTEGLECGKLNSLSDFVVYKAVIGDSSDNIPSSCTGVGKVLVGSLIPVINHFKTDDGWDFTNYPTTEEDMKKLCAEVSEQTGVQIKYRKAFLNFNSYRFFKNVELVDLSKVEFVPEIIDSIKATISNSRSQVDYFRLASAIAECEIRELNIDTLMAIVKNRFANLFVEGSNQ